MKMHATALAAGGAGFLVGGEAGAVITAAACAALLIAYWRLLRGGRSAQALRRPQALRGPAEPPQPSPHADIYDVIDGLDDIARERNWNLAKRFDIARMACENPTMTIDDLEHRYHQRIRSAPDKIRQDAPESPKDDGSV